MRYWIRYWRLLALAVAFLSLAVGSAEAQIVAAERGSTLRGEILDAIRPTFAAETNGAVEFVVRRINVLGDWAYGEVALQRPGGGAIDWGKTKYAEDSVQGMFDPAQSIFLLHRAANGWEVSEFATGPTDIAWDSWRTDHQLPRELFVQ
jgi:hypothetical protein